MEPAQACIYGGGFSPISVSMLKIQTHRVSLPHIFFWSQEFKKNCLRFYCSSFKWHVFTVRPFVRITGSSLISWDAINTRVPFLRGSYYKESDTCPLKGPVCALLVASGSRSPGSVWSLTSPALTQIIPGCQQASAESGDRFQETPRKRRRVHVSLWGWMLGLLRRERRGLVVEKEGPHTGSLIPPSCFCHSDEWGREEKVRWCNDTPTHTHPEGLQPPHIPLFVSIS